jgi:hypothetical protein
MRAQDIVIGETYRHRDHPAYCYAKAIKIIRPMAKYKQYGLTEDEKTLKCVCVKCEWTQSKNDSFGLIKYFRPCDLVKDA